MNPSSPQRTLTTQELRDLIDTERDRVNLKRDALRKGSRRRSLEQQQKQQEEASSPPRAPLFHLPSETYSSTAKQLLRSSSSTMPSQQDTPKSIYADGVVESVETEHDKDVYMTVSISPIDNTHASDHSSDEEDLKEFAEDKDVPPPFPSNRRRRMVPLAVGIAAITAIAVGVYFFLDNNNVSLKSGAQHADFQGTVTAAELVEHNTPEDCWVLIGGTVYDLTEYAPTHPGGGRLITDLAGTDATKEYELEHPLSLMSTLPETIIGAIEEGYVPVYKNDDDESEDDDGTPFVATTAAPPPVEDPPVEDPPMEDPPVEDPPVEDPPVEDPPVEDPPVEDPPVEDPPVEDPPANGPMTAFISEIHYDNVGSDEGQLVEVAYGNQMDMSGYKVELYRGTTGLAYDTQSLQAFAIGASRNGLTFASRKVASFQNGVDGLALIDRNDNVVEFISYEGIMTAQDGYAAGMVSVEMGASQSGQDPQGWTLQKTGTGCFAQEFEWGINAEGTPGDINVGMIVNCFPDGAAVPAPAPWAETMAPTATCFADNYSLATINQHGTPQDCWHSILGIVYDFTDYIDEHGGGPGDIRINCGTEATEAYLDRHSRGLMRKAVQYIIGRFSEADGSLPVSCERRLEHADSGYWDEEWESVEEFENWVEGEDE